MDQLLFLIQEDEFALCTGEGASTTRQSLHMFPWPNVPIGSDDIYSVDKRDIYVLEHCIATILFKYKQACRRGIVDNSSPRL